MLTPKQRFLEHKVVAQKHRDTVDSNDFAIATDLALLQQLQELPHAESNEQAAANYYMIRGAMNYIKKLQTLGDTSPEKKSAFADNLDHKA